MLAAVATLAVGCSADDGRSGTDDTVTSSAAESSARERGRVRLVNLGDSFASGTGVRPLVEDSPIFCLRSSRNFAHIVAAEEDYDLVDVSCAGADTADLTDAQYEGVPPQLDALDGDTDVVTVMIGGNNEGTYGRAIDLCGQAAEADPLGAPCTERHGRDLIDPVDRDIYPAVREAVRRVRSKAPSADVLLIGYPWLVPEDGGCYPEMKVAAGDLALLRRLQVAVNDAGRRAADEEGARFVDMLPPSAGHDACAGPQRWIEPMTTSGPGRLHPNAAGQEAIAEQVRKALAG